MLSKAISSWSSRSCLNKSLTDDGKCPQQSTSEVINFFKLDSEGYLL